MKRAVPPWDLIATFLAVRQTGSLSAAARIMRLSQPTVRRQIEALEDYLATPLFTRSGTGLTPMPGTDGLMDLAAAMQTTAESFVRRATGSAIDVQGRVRISCSEIFAAEVLPPILIDLARNAPKITPELSVTNDTENLLQREADVAIRLSAPQQDALVAQKVATILVGLYAAPGPLADRYADAPYAEIQSDAAIVGEDKGHILENGFRAMGLAPPGNIVFRSDSQTAQLAVVRAGLAIGPCQQKIAERLGLIPICPEYLFPMECWVVMHEDLRQFPPVRVVFDHLVTALR